MAAIRKPIEIPGVLNTILGVGRRSDGMYHLVDLCTSPNINSSSLHKPYRNSSPATSLAARQAAKYGWALLTKQAGAATASFLDTIYAKGDQALCWDYNKPRGLDYSEWFRSDDFDGYDTDMNHYREPIEFNRLAATELAISGTNRDAVIPKRQGLTLEYTSENFHITGAFEGIIKFQLTSPVPGPFIHWYVDGVVDIYLEDAYNRTVRHWNETYFAYQIGGAVPDLVVNLDVSDSLDEFTGPYHLRYRVLIDENETYYKQDSVPGAEAEYQDVGFRIRTEYAASLREDYRGTKGVYIKTARLPEAWTNTSPTAETAIFGQNNANLCVIQVSNGTTVQKKLAYADMRFIPFKKIGITIEPRQASSNDDVIVYMFRGPISVFPGVSAGGDLWGDITLANSVELLTFPHAMKKLGNMPAPPQPIDIYSDDCQGIWVWINGRTEPYAFDEPKEGGLVPAIPGDEYECNRIRVKWNIGIDNYPAYGTLTAHLATYDGEGDNVLFDEKTQEFAITPATSQTAYIDLTANCIPYTANSVWIKLWFELNGVVYYVNMFPQRVQDNNPGQWNIGDGRIFQD